MQKIAAPVAQVFVPMPHNAQPGQGSLPHWMPSSRTFRPCMMCSGIQEPREHKGKSGVWCPQCQFFTEANQ